MVVMNLKVYILIFLYKYIIIIDKYDFFYILVVLFILLV